MILQVKDITNLFNELANNSINIINQKVIETS